MSAKPRAANLHQSVGGANFPATGRSQSFFPDSKSIALRVRGCILGWSSRPQGPGHQIKHALVENDKGMHAGLIGDVPDRVARPCGE